MPPSETQVADARKKRIPFSIYVGLLVDSLVGIAWAVPLVVISSLTIPWTTIQRSFSKAPMVRLSVVWLGVVPILARLLVHLGPEIDLTGVGLPIVLPLELPFSWKLLYAGALSFTAAQVVYAMRCPRLIRDFSSLSEYKDGGKGSAFLVREFLAVMLPSLRGSRPENSDRTQDILMHFLDEYGTGGVIETRFPKQFNLISAGSSYEHVKRRVREGGERGRRFLRKCGIDEPRRVQADNDMFEFKEERLPEAFEFVREQLDIHRAISRFLCCVLFYFGYAAFIAVCSQGAWYVWRTF